LRKPNVSYFKVFSCNCFILNTKDNPGKFDAKSYEAIIVRYSNTSKAYRVFNRSTLTIEESIHVKFEESNIFVKNVVEIDFLGEDMEKIALNDSPIEEENSKIDVQGEVKRLKRNLLARRPITLVLMMINSCSYYLIILCLISIRYLIKILIGV